MIFCSHALTKLNYASDFSLSKVKIIPMPVLVLRRRLRGLICGDTAQFSVVECKSFGMRQLGKNFISAVFF